MKQILNQEPCDKKIILRFAICITGVTSSHDRSQILHACRHLLEEEGVIGLAELHQYSLDFVALDADLWSLEMPEFYRRFYLDGCTALVEPVARAVWRLQSLCGLIPRVHGHGRAAQQVSLGRGGCFGGVFTVAGS